MVSFNEEDLKKYSCLPSFVSLYDGHLSVSIFTKVQK